MRCSAPKAPQKLMHLYLSKWEHFYKLPVAFFSWLLWTHYCLQTSAKGKQASGSMLTCAISYWVMSICSKDCLVQNLTAATSQCSPHPHRQWDASLILLEEISLSTLKIHLKVSLFTFLSLFTVFYHRTLSGMELAWPVLLPFRKCCMDLFENYYLE